MFAVKLFKAVVKRDVHHSVSPLTHHHKHLPRQTDINTSFVSPAKNSYCAFVAASKQYIYAGERIC